MKRQFAMSSRILALIMSLLGCFKAINSAPLTNVTKDDEHNRVFPEQCDLNT